MKTVISVYRCLPSSPRHQAFLAYDAVHDRVVETLNGLLGDKW